MDLELPTLSKTLQHISLIRLKSLSVLKGQISASLPLIYTAATGNVLFSVGLEH